MTSMTFSRHFEYLYWIKTAANTKSANSNHFEKALEMKVRETPGVLNITSLMSQVISVAQSFSNSRWSSGCHASYTWYVRLFCVENYGTEAASCLAFPWVFQNEILMEIGRGWSYGTAGYRKTNDHATKIHFMWLQSTRFVSSGCLFSIIIKNGGWRPCGTQICRFVQCKYKIAAS